MDRDFVHIFSELGRRMASFGAVTAGPSGAAARNVACDMLRAEVLREWLGRYPDLPVAAPRNVLIITAGNIPFVGLHDLLCVLAAGHRAMVKPSSKDAGNMTWVVTQLLDISPDTPVSIYSGEAPDAVVAMGGDAAVAAIGARWAGRPMLLRGNRSSAALLSGDENADGLAGLVDDMVLFSGLGCRNVSLLWVPRGYDFSRLGRTLAERAGHLGNGLGSGLETRWLNSLRQTRALLKMSGSAHSDLGPVILVEERDFSPRPGVVNYTFYDSSAEATDWLSAHDEQIQCVATDSATLSHPRAVPLGRTQHPGPGDYPDGRDTMQFLATI